MNRVATEIRMAVPDDATSIESVLYQSFLEYKSAYTEEGFGATTPTKTQIQTRITEWFAWVAVQGESVVGAVFAIPEGDALHLRSMAVLPLARGEGVGRLLLKHVEDFASTNGYRRLFLNTTPFLTRAIHLYENFGFRAAAGKRDWFGTPLTTMVKALS